MAYTVTYVSRGSVYLTDGTDNYIVDGEGLHAEHSDDYGYVLYSDSLRCVTDNADVVVSGETKTAIINAIKEDFAANRMKIDIV